MAEGVGPAPEGNRALAAEILASGNWKSFTDVSDRCGVSRVTLWKWRKDPTFLALLLDELENHRDSTAQDIELRVLRSLDGLTAILEAPESREELLSAAALLPPKEMVRVGQYVSGLLQKQKRVEVMVSGEVAHVHRYAAMTEEELRAETQRRAGLLGLGGIPGSD